jgi:uridine kinase
MGAMVAGGPFVVGIDGRCGAGKSALADALLDRFDAAVVRMDDFYLPPELRTPERLAAPDGNIDWERFEVEVAAPLRAGQAIAHRRYDCQTGVFGPAVCLPDKPVLIIEGAYALHPSLAGLYGLTVFVSCDPQTQLARLGARAPDRLGRFVAEWIPAEERYFERYRIPEAAEVKLDTSEEQVR